MGMCVCVLHEYSIIHGSLFVAFLTFHGDWNGLQGGGGNGLAEALLWAGMGWAGLALLGVYASQAGACISCSPL